MDFLFNVIKRLFEFVFSLLITIALSPVLIGIVILIKLFDGKKPAIYKQQRVGVHGKSFYIYKFRTMCDNVELSAEQLEEYNREYKLKDDPRVTKPGRILRKTSLDELPQIINILKGDMSFVGPRPITAAEVELYGENKELLLSVKPGLTGYWQAYARNSATYESGERQEMELYYVKNRSLLLDIRILFKTVSAVITGDNAY